MSGACLDMKDHKWKVGKWGEEFGAVYLESIGYIILDRNYRTPSGEIDLIALDNIDGDHCLVFVEIKTRTNTRFGYPEEAVTRKKISHLLDAIDHYFENHARLEYEWRIDVIAIQRFSHSSKPDLMHFVDVVISDEEEY